jgi:hypothetical protein
MQRVFFKSSSHFDDNVQSQWSFVNRLLFFDVNDNDSWTFLRKRDALKDDAKTIKIKKNETNANITKKIELNDNTNDDEALWINSVNKLSSKWIMKQSSFFKNVLNIMIIFFNVNKNYIEIDYNANENFETINDDVNENDDEIWSKKKSTKIVFWFFSF